MKRLLILSAPLFLFALPVSAQDASAGAKASTSDLPASAKPKKVCRTIAVTGQRIASSICHTKDEWAEIDAANEEAAKKYADDISHNGSRNMGSGGMDAGGGASSGPH
jgi:hypothetical protein